MTVREALQFNSLMCQAKTTSKKDKIAYVERVIKLLGMEYYADAVVGVPGEGTAFDLTILKIVSSQFNRTQYRTTQEVDNCCRARC
jgi:ATP-binding cassette subfamily G (WHITE) protein 2 (PDR)